jgi:hypothetical protein
MKQSETLTDTAINEILSEVKESPVSEPKITLHYRKFFPPDYSPKQIEAVIVELLRTWQQARLAET